MDNLNELMKETLVTLIKVTRDKIVREMEDEDREELEETIQSLKDYAEEVQTDINDAYNYGEIKVTDKGDVESDMVDTLQYSIDNLLDVEKSVRKIRYRQNDFKTCINILIDEITKETKDDDNQASA